MNKNSSITLFENRSLLLLGGSIAISLTIVDYIATYIVCLVVEKTNKVELNSWVDNLVNHQVIGMSVQDVWVTIKGRRISKNSQVLINALVDGVVDNKFSWEYICVLCDSAIRDGSWLTHTVNSISCEFSPSRWPRERDRELVGLISICCESTDGDDIVSARNISCACNWLWDS